MSARNALVTHNTLEDFGTIFDLTRPQGYGQVRYVDMLWGGHADLVGFEGVVDQLDYLLSTPELRL